MESKEKVTTSLKTAKEALVSLSEALDQKKDEFIRDSVIKRFELPLSYLGKQCEHIYYLWEKLAVVPETASV